MIKQQLFIGAALLAGAAAGYFLRGESAAVKPETAAKAPPKAERRERIPNSGLEASNAALRRRVAELERQLAEFSDDALGATNAAMPVAEAPKMAEQPRPRSWKEFREQMKKKDPAGYARMTNHMARFAQHQRQRAEKKLSFLDAIDTSGMSAAAQRTHQRFQELLVQREELRDNMKDEEMSEEDRRANFDQMRKVDSELRSVNAAERRNLLGETAKNLGLSGDEATAFSSTIEQVIDATRDDFRPPPPPR